MRGRQIDYPILITVFLLTVFGLMMLASASSDLGKTKFDNSYYYLQHQIYYGLSLGIVGFFAGLYLPLRWYKKFSTFALLLSVMSLIIVFTPLGYSAGTAAERWIAVGPVTFQPSEILKLTFVF
ncbi:MAG: FtsW/RodA/SpoVE family cell cycle protein, partial [Patescibacteria group bacterium]